MRLIWNEQGILEVCEEMKSLLKGPALVYYLVRKLYARHPDKQIGRTKIQKLMYLFDAKGGTDLGYSLYHYGPYSPKVTSFTNLAQAMGWLRILWDSDKGYFISPKREAELASFLAENEMKVIDTLVEEFGSYTATQLSVIATALFVKRVFNERDFDTIVDIVAALKQKYSKQWIRKVLESVSLLRSSRNS